MNLVERSPKKWSIELKAYIYKEYFDTITMYKSDTHYLRVVCHFKVVLSSPSWKATEPGEVVKRIGTSFKPKMLARFFAPSFWSYVSA